MATYKPKKKIDKNGTLDDIKFPMDSIYGLADEFKKKGVHFISDSDITVTSGSSSLSEKWVVNGVDGITEPFDGMLIAIRIPSRGSSPKGVVLSINGGNNYNSLIIVETGSATSFYSAYQNQATILFSFNAIRTGTAYLESGVATNITGCWQTADRDNNYIVTQSKNSEDKEKPILTKYSDSTSTSSGPTSFGLNVTINHAKGRLSATELRENGVSLAEKYALKDEVSSEGGKITRIDEDPDNITDVATYDRFISYKSTAYVEYEDETYSDATTINYIPISAGENIKFDVDNSSADEIVKISTDLPTVKAKLTPASEVGGGSVVSITDIASFEIEDIATIRNVDDGAGILVENEISPLTKDGDFLDTIKLNTYIPISAGKGIEFQADEYNQIVSINANALKATKQNEFDSLIAEENEDKTISYKGKLYVVSSKKQGGSSINANDTVETLYFNTDIEPNFSDFVFEDGGAGLFITDTNPTTGMVSLLIVFEVTEESFGAGTPNGYALAIQHDGQLRTLYATEDYDVGNIHASKGWNVDKFELGWSATIQTVLQQEKWGTFISKTPFNKEIFAKEVGGGGISGAWASGAGGTLTLPEAGTYQLKTDFSDGTVGGVTTFSQIVCWDGNLPTESATIMTLVESDLMCYRFSIGATGVINIKVTVYGQYPTEMDWANMNVEYRKIGEA